jgi:hypothetical protein
MKTMMKVINDMLDFSRIEVGVINVQNEEGF